MGTNRDTSRDGLRNKIELYALTHFGPVWEFVSSVEPLRRFANRRSGSTDDTNSHTGPKCVSAYNSILLRRPSLLVSRLVPMIASPTFSQLPARFLRQELWAHL